MTTQSPDPLLRSATDDGGIRTLTIDVSDRPMNVLSPPLRLELIAAMDAALEDDTVTGIILASDRPEFIAGADLSALSEMRGKPAAEVRAFSDGFRAMLRRMELGGKPIVAAINGTALGGGFELCLACHHRIAADVEGAVIGLPEASLGLLPGAGGTQRLGRMIGIAKALPLVLNGSRLSPGAAYEAGLVDDLVPLDGLIAAAKAWISANPAPQKPWDQRGSSIPGGGPEVPQNHRLFIEMAGKAQAETGPNDATASAILSCFFEGLRVPFDTGLEIEARQFSSLARGDVAQNRIRSFFSMTAARKAATRPADIPRFAPKKIGILGAGLMGSGLAEVAARKGLSVVLLDRDVEAARAGYQTAAKSMEKSVTRGKLTSEAASAALGRIDPVSDMAALSGCDAIIEAVYEDRGVKAEVTRAALAATGPDVLFASNTSKLPITGLAEASPAPERFIGMHFFSPVPRMALVEIILGDATGAAAHAQALDLAKTLGKIPVVVRDGRGFFTSRVFSTYMNEGLAMLCEGVAPALIENSGRQAGYPLGPLAMADEISQETMLRIRSQERDDLGADWIEGSDFAVVSQFVEMGRIGRRAKAGFYDYPEEGPRHLWAGLADLYPVAADQPDPKALRQRFLHIQATEAARAWDEGVIDDPRMADVGSQLGWSHPSWTGGVMSYIDQGGGVAAFVAEGERLAKLHGPRFTPPPRLVALAAEGKSLYG
jgi:3-hydroxyacyl-CoA dehydrogenase/enoyl-CoA hydratase/3-hydroxybutyryl-CoA epimerase